MPRLNAFRSIGRGFSLIEVLIVVTIIAIIAGLVFPHYSNASDNARASSLLTDLQMIRQRLQAYRNDHNGQYPLLSEMWGNLTGQTDQNGNPGAEFGPYLKTEPLNPFTDGRACADDNSADWQYDEIEGTIRAVVPADKIASLNLSPLDAVAAP